MTPPLPRPHVPSARLHKSRRKQKREELFNFCGEHGWDQRGERRAVEEKRLSSYRSGVSISHLAFCTRSVFRRETDPACARHRWREETAGGSSTSCAACKARPHQEESCLACTEGRDQSGPSLCAPVRTRRPRCRTRSRAGCLVACGPAGQSLDTAHSKA